MKKSDSDLAIAVLVIAAIVLVVVTLSWKIFQDIRSGLQPDAVLFGLISLATISLNMTLSFVHGRYGGIFKFWGKPVAILIWIDIFAGTAISVLVMRILTGSFLHVLTWAGMFIFASLILVLTGFSNRRGIEQRILFLEKGEKL